MKRDKTSREFLFSLPRFAEDEVFYCILLMSLRGQSLFRGSFTFNVCNWGQIISSLYRGKLFFRGATIRGLLNYSAE